MSGAGDVTPEGRREGMHEIGGDLEPRGDFGRFNSEIHGTPTYAGPTYDGDGHAPHAPQATTPTWAAARRDGKVRAPEPQSYYGRPVVKPPEWKPEIAAYFFVGGMAGASAGLAFGADLTGNRSLARRAWAVSLAGLAVSPGLLIYDLGKPARFLNMLRVFKVTSPMSVGSWILSGMGATTAAAAAGDLLGLFPRAARAARPLAAVLGTGLATYTAALVADTANPVWHAARRELPFIFAGSAMASAGGAALVLTRTDLAGPARRLTAIGSALELGAGVAMERRLGGLLARLYHHGHAGRLSKAARASTLAGVAVTGAAARRSRPAAIAAGMLALAGSCCERFAIYHAGFAAARDPRYTVDAQRARRVSASLQAP